MPWLLPVGMAAAGAIGGAFKSGPDLNLPEFDSSSIDAMRDSFDRYKQLAQAGPGSEDVSDSLGASRGFADLLQQTQQQGMYDFSTGERLAAQQFGAQRLSMEQSFQDQLRDANRAASAAGRSQNDPILRARLAQEQTRQGQMLAAQQSSAAVGFARQAQEDKLNLAGQRVNILGNLSQQAFGNEGNLFNMQNSINNANLQAYQSQAQTALGSAQYEQRRGGGVMGALTGALSGAASGLSMAGSLTSLLGGGAGQTGATAANAVSKAAGGVAGVMGAAPGAGDMPVTYDGTKAGPINDPNLWYRQGPYAQQPAFYGSTSSAAPQNQRGTSPYSTSPQSLGGAYSNGGFMGAFGYLFPGVGR